MFSYKANSICMAGMTMPAGAGVAASHCWNRVRKPGQLINYARFWPHRWTFAKNRTAHAQTHYRKGTQWQWASFVSATWPFLPVNFERYYLSKGKLPCKRASLSLTPQNVSHVQTVVFLRLLVIYEGIIISHVQTIVGKKLTIDSNELRRLALR